MEKQIVREIPFLLPHIIISDRDGIWKKNGASAGFDDCPLLKTILEGQFSQILICERYGAISASRLRRLITEHLEARAAALELATRSRFGSAGQRGARNPPLEPRASLGRSQWLLDPPRCNKGARRGFSSWPRNSNNGKSGDLFKCSSANHRPSTVNRLPKFVN